MSGGSKSLSLRNAPTELEVHDFTGATTEIIVALDTSRPSVHDGKTPGGKKLALLEDLDGYQLTYVPTGLWDKETSSEGVPDFPLPADYDNSIPEKITATLSSASGQPDNLIMAGYDSLIFTDSYFEITIDANQNTGHAFQFTENGFHSFNLSPFTPESGHVLMVHFSSGIAAASTAQGELLETNILDNNYADDQPYTLGIERSGIEWFFHTMDGNRVLVHRSTENNTRLMFAAYTGLPSDHISIEIDVNAPVPSAASAGVVALGSKPRISSESPPPEPLIGLLAGKRMVIDESLPGKPHLSVDIDQGFENNLLEPDSFQRSWSSNDIVKFIEYKLGNEVAAHIDPDGTPDHKGVLKNLEWSKNHDGNVGVQRFTFTDDLYYVGSDEYVVIAESAGDVGIDIMVNQQSRYFEIKTVVTETNAPVEGRFRFMFKRVTR